MTRALAINTYGYIWSTPAEACVRRLAALGYGHFELMIHPPHLPLDNFGAAERRVLRAALAEVGATVSSINMPSLDQNLASAFPRVRRASIAMFQDAIDLAADLGAPWLVTVPGRMSPLFPAPVGDRTAWLTDAIGQLLPRAQSRGVGLAIENVPFAGFPDAASLGAFVRSFDSPHVGVCYDAANAHFIGEDPAEGLYQLGDLVRVAHLSDTTRDIWRHDRVGLGDVPCEKFLRALDEIGFEGPCTLEIIGGDAEGAILESHRALAPFGVVPCSVRSAS
ncbi:MULTISPECIES: sugar phosphate isomerase/epimerase family protein [unclassified Bradyrhizobium]|uniref:sugar phosphate isomerase/epimerase family protein n=1 Tax=unclassified Bradyrhizobium TaxID=2631580 RepID=UPI0028E9E8C4|nr:MULTISPECIES: sugar phosphate isomerase/epimerase family protein [unclassified Bradyrhizobium]